MSRRSILSRYGSGAALYIIHELDPLLLGGFLEDPLEMYKTVSTRMAISVRHMLCPPQIHVEWHSIMHISESYIH